MKPATSVHRLRPSDISVVAALGDSLTSANGALAYTEADTRNNYRGVSASGGWHENFYHHQSTKILLAKGLRSLDPLLHQLYPRLPSRSPLTIPRMKKEGKILQILRGQNYILIDSFIRNS